MELESLFRERISASVAVKQALADNLHSCLLVTEMLIDAYRGGRKLLLFGNGGSAADAQHIAAEFGRKLLLFGNGGSAADAQHIAAEFLGRFRLERRAMPAVALTVNTSALTAIGNDYAFESVFARQLEAMAAPGDVAVGISTSGNARNVIEGLRAARRGGVVSVALTGAAGGLLAQEAEYAVRVPSDDTARIQEAHILIGHVWSEAVEQALFGS